MNSNALMNKSPNARLEIDCQEITPLRMLSAFSVPYLPKCTSKASLVNLPTKKAGII